MDYFIKFLASLFVLALLFTLAYFLTQTSDKSIEYYLLCFILARQVFDSFDKD